MTVMALRAAVQQPCFLVVRANPIPPGEEVPLLPARKVLMAMQGRPAAKVCFGSVFGLLSASISARMVFLFGNGCSELLTPFGFTVLVNGRRQERRPLVC